MSTQVKDANGSVVNTPAFDPGYRFASGSLAPGATPTTIIQLQGAAGTKVRVKRIALTLQSGTVAGGSTYTLNRRSATATGGTANVRTAIKNDSGDSAPAAVLSDYTGFPTVGTLTGTVGAGALVASATAAQTQKDTLVWEFSNRLDKSSTLSSASEFLTVDQATALATGQILSYEIQWEEGAN